MFLRRFSLIRVRELKHGVSWRRALDHTFVAFVVILCPMASTATDVPFTDHLVYSNSRPMSTVAVDLDHDGDLDLVTTWFTVDSVGWLENTSGDGSAWTSHEVYNLADGPQSVAVADLDDDGDLDLVYASAGDDSVRWQENLGGSPLVFDPTPDLLTGNADYARSVTTGDLDGDGDIDVVSCSYFDDEVAWYENDGASNPSFSKHTLLHKLPSAVPDLADAASEVALADVNGDGALDILWSGCDNDRIGWFANTGGTPAFSSSANISDGLVNGPEDVWADDIDGDGDIDVLTCGKFDDTVRWFRNDDGVGTSWTPLVITSDADFAWTATTSDVDRDGDMDVLVASHTDNLLAWHENTNGIGTEWTPHAIDVASGDAMEIAFADIDGDGDGDLATAAYDGNAVNWYRNKSIHRSVVFTTRHLVSSLSGTGPNDVEIGDLDSDGDPDLVVSSFWDRTVRWYDNDLAASSSFTTRTLYTAGTNRYTEAVTLADLDRDGDLDVVSAYNDLLAGATNDAVYWHDSNGAVPPVFTHRNVTSIADGPVSLDTGDLDSDGDLDIVSGSKEDDTLRWYQNNGNSPPIFSPITMYDNVQDPMTIWAEDLHHHGEVDILTATQNQDITFWLWNDGAATPSFAAYDATYAADGPRAVAAADFNRDGTLDAVVAGEFNDGIWWLANDFTSIWTAYPITSTLDGATAVAGHDLDHDGDVDIVAAGYVDDEIVWFDNGASTPWDWTERLISSAHNGPRSVAVADLDRDGDLDIAAASLLDSEVAWFENQGSHAALSTTSSAPRFMIPGERDDVLKITAQHRGRAGDSSVEFSRLGLYFETAPGVPLEYPQAIALMDLAGLCEDADGSGTFDPDGPDQFSCMYWSISVTDGLMVTNLGSNPVRRIEHGTPRTYFVIISLTEDAASQGIDSFRVTHLTDSASEPNNSAVHDWTHDISLDLESSTDVSSDWMTIALFADGFESGDCSAWSGEFP